MIDELLTALARVMARHVRSPRLLVIQAWIWLAANARTAEEKRRCLNSVLQLDPDNEPATLALLVLDQKKPTSPTPAHDGLRPVVLHATMTLETPLLIRTS